MYNLEDEKLDEKQQRAILLLAEGKNNTEVANELGVNRSTIYRWKTEDEIFLVELNRLKKSLWQASQTKLFLARTGAIEELIKLLKHDDPKIKMKAIEIIMKTDFQFPIGRTSIRKDEHYDPLSELLEWQKNGL